MKVRFIVKRDGVPAATPDYTNATDSRIWSLGAPPMQLILISPIASINTSEAVRLMSILVRLGCLARTFDIRVYPSHGLLPRLHQGPRGPVPHT